MSFGWINWINMAAVVYLIVINMIAARKGIADSFNSKVPVALFLVNGVLLRHLALVVASLIFGIFHLAIVRENV